MAPRFGCVTCRCAIPYQTLPDQLSSCTFLTLHYRRHAFLSLSLSRSAQLSLFSVPLQLIAIYQLDRHELYKHGLLQGFHASTWLLVALQVAGALRNNAAAVVKEHSVNHVAYH